MTTPPSQTDPVTRAWTVLQDTLQALTIPEDEHDPCVRAWHTYITKLDTSTGQDQLITAAAYEWRQAYPNLQIDCVGLVNEIRRRWGVRWFDRAGVHTILDASYTPQMPLRALATITEKARFLLRAPQIDTVDTLIKDATLTLCCRLEESVFSRRHTALSLHTEQALQNLGKLIETLFHDANPVTVPIPTDLQALWSHRDTVTGRRWPLAPFTLQFFQNGRLTIKGPTPGAVHRLTHALLHPTPMPTFRWRIPKHLHPQSSQPT